FPAEKSAAGAAYDIALNTDSERLNVLQTAGKNAKAADEIESQAWQILSEIYLSVYITPQQRKELTRLAAESMFNLGLTEDQYKTPLEGLDHFFALSILAQSRYSEVETEQDYINIERGIAKTREVPSDIIRTIENSTDRPFVSGTYFAAALRAIYDFAGAEAFYKSEQKLRARVLKEEENPYLWAELAKKLKNKIMTRYGDIENYSLKERYSYALCDESIYPLTKQIVNNNFYNAPDMVFKVNSALCLLNATDATDKQRTDAAAFIEKTYFTRDVETRDPTYGVAVLDTRQEPAPDGTFISDLSPKEASLLRQRMVNILYQNFSKYGNKYLKGNYADAVKRADGKPRTEEVIFHYGVLAAEFIAVDIGISALSGGSSLTVSLPRWGGKIIVWGATRGRQTFEVFKAAGLVEGGAVVWTKTAVKSAETLAKMKQIPAAAAQAVKNGMGTAIDDPAFAGMASAARISPAMTADLNNYSSSVGKLALSKIELGPKEAKKAYTALKQAFGADIRDLNASITKEISAPNAAARYANQQKLQEINKALSYYENTAFKEDLWLKKARLNYYRTEFYAATNIPVPAGSYVLKNLDDYGVYKFLQRPGELYPLKANPSELYRGMALDEKSILNIAKNGMLKKDVTMKSGMHVIGVTTGTPSHSGGAGSIWTTENPVVAANTYSTLRINNGKSIPTVFHINKNAPGINWQQGVDGIYTSNNIPASAINKISVLLEINGKRAWGQLSVEKGFMFFKPY
ncbi:MAG: hypothetical protein LBI01_05060, partial [Elusimicrobium sp.]|nr:hypothetical protein [Elusimicrobium sp.]